MWTAIVIIVIAAIAGEVFRQHARARSSAGQQELEAINARIDALESDLRARVETLERIVTDGKEDLRRQFDQLDRGA
jgi:uncharacterized protein HemX